MPGGGPCPTAHTTIMTTKRSTYHAIAVLISGLPPVYLNGMETESATRYITAKTNLM